MKVIGKTEGGFITTITDEEMLALFAVTDQRRTSEHFKKITVGADITFTVALANLNLLKDIKLTGRYQVLGELETAKEELEKVIKVVQKVNSPLIELQSQIKESQS